METKEHWISGSVLGRLSNAGAGRCAGIGPLRFHESEACPAAPSDGNCEPQHLGVPTTWVRGGVQSGSLVLEFMPRAWRGRQHDSRSCSNVLGQADIRLALCCASYGWRWRVDANVEFVVDLPEVARQVDGVYHCETGPAVRYRDGWSIYALHGICVPAHVITNPERITIEEIRTERNVELRRVLRERYGEERYLAATGATLLDVDTVPVDALAPAARSITRALIVDEDSRRFLVSSDGSTRRVYHMEVPVTCTTCAEAYVALSGREDVRTILQA